jgi:hypothetical protein
VIGEAISVIEATYTGHPRGAMVTRGRRGDGREYGVSFADVDFADGTETRASWPDTPVAGSRAHLRPLGLGGPKCAVARNGQG